MRRVVGIILAGFCLLGALSSCRKNGRVIPAAMFSDIYADMFVADQWMSDHPEYRRTADTTQFYEAVFRRYGYSFRDYDASVRHYLKKPEKYAKIVKRTSEKLESDYKKLLDIQENLEHLRRLMQGIGGYERVAFQLDSVFVDSLTLWPVFTADSVAVADPPAGRESIAAAKDDVSVPEEIKVVDKLQLDSMQPLLP